MSRSFENIASTAVSWTTLFSVFMMNVQLGQNYHQRDQVDHAAAVAGDTLTKTLCADAKDYGGVAPGEYAGARKQAVERAVKPLLGLVAPEGACKVNAKSASGGASAAGADPGRKDMDLSVSCEIPCRIPVAAQVMCRNGQVSFEAKQKATATGCDSGTNGGGL